MVDILIATALQIEFDAARDAGLDLGIDKWEEAGTNPYLLGRYTCEGLSLKVALWDSTRMGSVSVGPVVGALVERLKPRCLAMSGVCAGNPSDMALGDVIIAEMVYQYDEGKRDPTGFTGDYRQRDLPSDWLRAAQKFVADGLPSFGPPSDNDARIWLLERLYANDDPWKHPARDRYFGPEAWESTVRGLEAAQLISRKGLKLALTPTGRSEIEETLFFRVQVPKKLPFQVKVGPIASGNVVVKDGTTWDDLKKGGVRTVLGLEMEAAAIGNAAFNLGVPNWLVVKGVMDHADIRKDDRYKPFAARASAEVLFKFLAAHLCPSSTPRRMRPTLVKSVYLIGGVSGETSYPDFEPSQLSAICASLGRVIANSGADLVVCSPFPDSADHHAVRGYVEAGKGGRIHFHSPHGEVVARMRLQLQNMLGPHETKILDYLYPGPEDLQDKEQVSQSWLLCQLQALERADAVIAIGGRLGGTANTLLHLAEAKRIPVVPFAFLGGAAERLFKRRDWRMLYPGFDPNVLLQKQAVDQAMELADRFLAERIRGVRYGGKPMTFFISRAQAENEFGDRLAAFLRSKGLTPLLGNAEVRSERMVQPSIEDAILQSDVCIVLWTRSYGLSTWCIDELELALQRESAGAAKIWLFNLDGSDIVPRPARRLPQAVVRTPEALMETVAALLAFNF